MKTPLLYGFAGIMLANVMPALADGPDLSGASKTVTLRFLDAPGDGRIEKSPTLHMSFGGKKVLATMDTGSTGIVVSQDIIPDIDTLPSQGPGRLTYTSSGKVMIGRWVVTPVTISGAGEEHVSTAPLPVLAVSRMECLRQSRDCEPRDNPGHIVMMGVGFAREGARQGESTPDKNPFLHVDAMEAGSMRRGYVVTSEAIQLGISPGTAKGFGFVKLDPGSVEGDWAATPACLALNGGQPQCGTVLVDTGVTTMFLTLPPEAEQGSVEQDGNERKLAGGTNLAIRFGDAGSGLGYSFAVGGGASSEPEKILLMNGENRPVFVNTSVRALNAFDYLFDADGGYVGFRVKER